MKRTHFATRIFIVASAALAFLSSCGPRDKIKKADFELARFLEIARKGRSIGQITEELEASGFRCTDVTDRPMGKSYDADFVYVCRKEFRERGRLFPTQMNAALLVASDGTLSSSVHNFIPLSL
jgi:hypothetical protein